MTRDELLTDVEWDVLGGDQIEAAQIAAANNRAPVKPAPESTERLFDDERPDSVRLVGDLAASAIPRGYGIGWRVMQALRANKETA